MASQNMISRAFRDVRKGIAHLRARPGQSASNLKRIYVDQVNAVKARLPYKEAMESAVGGHFALIGGIERALLGHYGLPKDGYVIDVGCGSGRLAQPLSDGFDGRYLGIDLVPDLIRHARRLVNRPGWRFEVIDHIGIPEADAQADMVCFFSVMTHLLHDQSYWYLEEAFRVLKPGGRLIFSFLEFAEPAHWQIFHDTVARERRGIAGHMNIFIEASAIEVWAQRLGMTVVDIRRGGDVIVPEGALGQSVCVLAKP